jgi:hypothetical protein
LKYIYKYILKGTEYPRRCSYKDVIKQKQSAAVYYCNLLDFNIGFVQYPVKNLEPPPYEYTTSPTLNPTLRPSPLPGEPTLTPTPDPTKRPTPSPSPGPTPG